MTARRQYGWLGAFVDGLAEAGVEDVCWCPGSRSTPLALLFHEHPGIRMWRHLDERSASFFGLGLARGSGYPVGLFCTSGTAAAEFLPAVIEARYGGHPLLLLTADRPHEARGIGAPQTIDQIRLYGDHVKTFIEMPVPSPEPSLKRWARHTAARAVETACSGPPGPVHLNFPFREPLVEEPLDAGEVATPSARPSIQVHPGAVIPTDAEFELLARLLRESARPLLVCGPQEYPGLGDAASLLAARLDAPVLADPLSQVRTGPHDRSRVMDAYDALLRSEAFTAEYRPDLAVRFGAAPTSRPLMRFLEGMGGSQLLVDPWRWNDPMLSAIHIVRSDPIAFCERMARVPDDVPPERAEARSGWIRAWREADRSARSLLQKEATRDPRLFEGAVFADLAALLPDGVTLFAGNSMPVRDLDTFFGGTGRAVRFLANRGANGIDGVVSTALGVAATGGRVVLVIGDLSFYHDMNGMLAAGQHGLDATIVLLHNDGGGIFSFLPQAEEVEPFEELFGTPHGLDFKPAVEMYGSRFVRPPDRPSFAQAVTTSLEEPGVTVIEVRTDRSENVARHREIAVAVQAGLGAKTSR